MLAHFPTDPDRAIIPRHCAHCDGLVRLHIRVRTDDPISRVWECPRCKKPNHVTGRWRFMTVVRDFDQDRPRPASHDRTGV